MSHSRGRRSRMEASLEANEPETNGGAALDDLGSVLGRDRGCAHRFVVNGAVRLAGAARGPGLRRDVAWNAVFGGNRGTMDRDEPRLVKARPRDPAGGWLRR